MQFSVPYFSLSLLYLNAFGHLSFCIKYTAKKKNSKHNVCQKISKRYLTQPSHTALVLIPVVKRSTSTVCRGCSNGITSSILTSKNGRGIFMKIHIKNRGVTKKATHLERIKQVPTQKFGQKHAKHKLARSIYIDTLKRKGNQCNYKKEYPQEGKRF